MSKYKNIGEYMKKEHLTRSDLQFFITRTALDFGCRVAHMEEDELQDTENMFNTLYFFNDIVNNVE